MALGLKVLVIASALMLITIDGFPARTRTKYETIAGQPSNIHYVVKEPQQEKTGCEKKIDLPPEKKGKCQTAEIIKVPTRTTECPKNMKKDAKGRCRPSWN